MHNNTAPKRGSHGLFGLASRLGCPSLRAAAPRAFVVAFLSSTGFLGSCTLINPYVRSPQLDCASAPTCVEVIKNDSGDSESPSVPTVPSDPKAVYAGGAAAAIDAANDQQKSTSGPLECSTASTAWWDSGSSA
jgi:hypothetical protein